MSNKISDNEKTQRYFKAIKVNSAIDPSNCYWVRLEKEKTLGSRAACEQVLNKCGELLPASRACAFIKSVIEEIAESVKTDLRARTIGNLKIEPVAYGKVKQANDAFPSNAEGGGIRLVVNFLPSYDAEVPLSSFDLVNRSVGPRVKLTTFYTANQTEEGKWFKGLRGTLNGENLFMSEDCTLTASWEENGETKSESLTILSSTPGYICFEWVTGLDEVAVGTEITFTVKCRGESAAEYLQTATLKVTLCEAISEE